MLCEFLPYNKVIQLYTHIHSFFQIVSRIDDHRILAAFSVLPGRSRWPVIPEASVRMCQSPTPSLSLPPCNLSPLVTIRLFSKSGVCFCSAKKFVCNLLQIPHTCDVVWYSSSTL